MEPWNYIRFVYETEDLLAIGGGSLVPTNVYDLPPDAPFIDSPTGNVPIGEPKPPTPKPSPTVPWMPKSPDQLCQDDPSRECDGTGSGYFFDPCWIINKYPGPAVYDEEGQQKILLGPMELTRGPSKAVVKGVGCVTLFGILNTPSVKAYGIWLEDAQGNKDCLSLGFPRPHSFNCQGPELQLQLVPSEVLNFLTVETMWDRFLPCMKEQHPECVTGEEGA